MSWLEALILGIVQGLTEFLPVSSSGHLEIGKALMNVDAEKSLIFTVVVHGATVLSTIVVFWKDIIKIFEGLFKFQWNDDTKYVAKIALSMVPVGIVGVFFKDEVEALFTSNMILVGSMLLVTASLLAFTFYAKERQKEITFKDSFIIGLAQACAVLPGISRSGSTIATGLLLGNKKDSITRFSFLMVLVPIIGANVKDMLEADFSSQGGMGITPLLVGFMAAFISGFLACKWMVGIVKKGKLIYFAIYCAIIGLISIGTSLFL
ncbi:MAG: undecaprenyl-diphosphate phosphatase [Bacteroidales bacterium]|nr:undecaprenyl-diphosphate phosphatase [Bacteroidales bacterium]